MPRVRILLCDDHKGMRDTVERLLLPEFEIVGSVSTGSELLKVESETRPDVCVVDISIPNVSGIEAAKQLRVLNSKTKIIFLTVHEDPAFIRAALDTGALGYVLKSRIMADLILAIREVTKGRQFISRSLKLAAGRVRLSDDFTVWALLNLVWLASQSNLVTG